MESENKKTLIIVRRLLRAIVSLIGNSVRIDALQRILEEELTRYARSKNKQKTLSDICFSTGIKTTRVKEILATLDDSKKEEQEPELTTLTRIIRIWQQTHNSSELYLNGPGNTLEGIVKRAGGSGVSLKTALRRLEESETIETNGVTAHLIKSEISAMTDDKASALMYGSDSIARLASTIENNITHGNKKRFERSVYTLVNAENVDALEEILSQKLTQFYYETKSTIRRFERKTNTKPTDTIEIGLNANLFIRQGETND